MTEHEARLARRNAELVQSLLVSASAAGEVRDDVDPYDLLNAVAYLCMSTEPGQSERMVGLLIDAGLRHQPPFDTALATRFNLRWRRGLPELCGLGAV